MLCAGLELLVWISFHCSRERDVEHLRSYANQLGEMLRADWVVLQVNLVATQLVLDREHPNRMVFSPARGLDPLVDPAPARGSGVAPSHTHLSLLSAQAAC